MIELVTRLPLFTLYFCASNRALKQTKRIQRRLVQYRKMTQIKFQTYFKPNLDLNYSQQTSKVNLSSKFNNLRRLKPTKTTLISNDMRITKNRVSVASMRCLNNLW